MIRWFRKLDNPFVLIAEGFVAGAILFWSTSPGHAETSPNQPTAQSVSALSVDARL